MEHQKCSHFFFQEIEISETSQLIDRYKFLDLYPCTSDELRILGYQKIESTKSIMKNRLAAAALASQQKDSGLNAAAGAAASAANGNEGGGKEDKKKKKKKEEECPFKPDISQMIPFKVGFFIHNEKWRTVLGVYVRSKMLYFYCWRHERSRNVCLVH